MARPTKVRKPSEEGRSTTLYLRRGTWRRASQEARRQRLSLSEFVEATLSEKLDAIEPARKAVA